MPNPTFEETHPRDAMGRFVPRSGSETVDPSEPDWESIDWDALEKSVQFNLPTLPSVDTGAIAQLALGNSTRLEDWAKQQDAKIDGAVAQLIQPLVEMNDQIAGVQAYVEAVFEEQRRTGHRKTMLLCGWAMFLGVAWMQLGSPVWNAIKGGVAQTAQVVTQPQTIVQKAVQVATGEGELDKLGCIQMSMPDPGEITSPFGKREAPELTGGGKGSSDHKGLDISNGEGTSISAAAAGKVLKAGDQNDGFGNSVRIYHGTVNGKRIEAVYGHMKSIAVKEGDLVSPGQAIGQEGQTGHANGPHLHFQVELDGEAVDPQSFLNKQWGDACPGAS